MHAGYGRYDVVRGIDLAVGEGEAVALLGPNGAGKSTVLRAVMGMLKHRHGAIRIGGVDVSSYPTHRIARGSHVGAYAVFGGDIGAEEARRVAQFLRGRVTFLVVDVEQRDLAAMRDEMLRHRVAETGGAAGDDCLYLIELHGESLEPVSKNRHGSRPAGETAG